MILNLIETWGDRYSRQLPPSRRVLALIFEQPEGLSNLAEKFLKVYPQENITSVQHKKLPIKVRALACIGVWLDALASSLAYRHATLKKG